MCWQLVSNSRQAWVGGGAMGWAVGGLCQGARAGRKFMLYTLCRLGSKRMFPTSSSPASRSQLDQYSRLVGAFCFIIHLVKKFPFCCPRISCEIAKRSPSPRGFCFIPVPWTLSRCTLTLRPPLSAPNQLIRLTKTARLLARWHIEFVPELAKRLPFASAPVC